MTEIELKREARRKDMLESKISRIIPVVALPMVITMLIDSFYNMADTFFVSQLGIAATAAVGINDSTMHFIRCIAMGFGMGAASYISRLLGAKRHDDASKVGTTTLITSFIFMIFLGAIAYLFIGPIVTFLGATPTIKPYCIQYARFILLAAPFTAGEVVLNQLLRSEGSTVYSMVGMCSGCIINLLLDPLFI
ncbi:MAG: MATE family efflux transporter, partial [Oscillospiraceae bacterium]|nr:MATE family efflux transporter [Oscillospiraceae bacterium]